MPKPSGGVRQRSPRAAAAARARSPGPARGGSSAKRQDAQSPAESDRGALLLTVLVLAVAGTAAISLSVPLPLTAESKNDLEALWLCCLSVSLPHGFYFWLWRSPQPWIARSKSIKVDPSQNMAKWAFLLKAVQASSFLVWVLTREPPGQVLAELKGRVDSREASLAVAVVLLAIGQVCKNACQASTPRGSAVGRVTSDTTQK